MSSLPRWMPLLLREINRACSNSPLLAVRHDNAEAIEAGRRICLELWPFIEQLPENISAVRRMAPEGMEAGAKLLTELADDERIYQQLFIKQCNLAGLKLTDLASSKVSASTQQLCDAMTVYCQSSDYYQGILAVITAELAATAFCRSALPLFEQYFAVHASSYNDAEIEEGLAWLKLHTKAQTKHALWLKRMLGEVESHGEQQLPEPVETVLKAIMVFLHCPPVAVTQSEMELSLAKTV